MSEYYEFVGSLTFESAKDAKEGHAALRGVHDGVTTFFWKPNGMSAKHTDLVVDGATLHFDWKGFSGGVEPYYKTLSILEELVKKAYTGRVRVKDEDGPDRYYGYKPKKAAAKKSAVKKSAAKKPAAKKTAATKKSPAKKKSTRK